MARTSDPAKHQARRLEIHAALTCVAVLGHEGGDDVDISPSGGSWVRPMVAKLLGARQLASQTSARLSGAGEVARDVDQERAVGGGRQVVDLLNTPTSVRSDLRSPVAVSGWG